MLLCCNAIFTYASIVTPEMFGAKNDGVTDDTEAFKEAIKTGNDVVLNGVYLINSVRLLSHQKMIGKNGARLIYNNLILLDGCILKDIELDGQWKTKGVTILGSEVQIEECSFLNTKNSVQYYGGLTSALWIGQYKDLEDNYIKYNNIRITNCIFDGCEPNDNTSSVLANKTTARCILSYGCDNLTITNCVFKNLKGYQDSDYIHLRSFEENSSDFPFYDENIEWKGLLPPFYGKSYCNAKTTIKRCVFYQNDCKSSIKVMSGHIKIENNTFIVNNASLNESVYSVVRMHHSHDVLVKRNKIFVNSGLVGDVVLIGNCLNVKVEGNIVTCGKDSHINSFVGMSYSKQCDIKYNQFDSFWSTSLLNTEYNRSYMISNNTFKIRNLVDGKISLFFQKPNHYAYPSVINGITVFENNKLIVPANNYDVELSNAYDYVVEFNNNIIVKN